MAAKRFPSAALTIVWALVTLTSPIFAAEPTNEEQFLLELVNRMRTNPVGELERLVNLDVSDPDNVVWLTPRSDIPGVDGVPVDGLNFVNLRNVDPQTLYNQFQALTSAPPLAWDPSLGDAATFQALQLIDPLLPYPGPPANPHTWGSVPGLGNRVDNAGYNDDGFGGPTGFDSFAGWGGIAENIATRIWATEQAHAAWAIDWSGGTANGGIQTPPGHRNAIMSPVLRDFGAALIGTDATPFVGPLVALEEFARPLGTSGTTPNYQPILTGVVYQDVDGDDFYTPGEGLAGVSVEVWDGTAQVAAANTWGSGGYSLAMPTGTFDVVIRGPGPPTTFASVDFVAGRNVKIDLDASGAEVSLALFAADFGRTDCDAPGSCPGDSDRDGDVDGRDAAAFGSTALAERQVYPAGD